MTPSDLFSQALRQVGVLGRGQHINAEQLNDAQTLCNMMLGQWARKRWLVFHLLEVYTQGTGSSTYTMGPNDIAWDTGETWSQSGLTQDMSTRSNRIEKAFVRVNAGQTTQMDLPLTVIRSQEDWSLVPIKNVQAGFPQAVFLDTGYPVATLNVWPAPSSQYEIHILLINPLIRITDMSTELNLPDEYHDAIFWNLCKRLLSSYRKPKDPEIEQQAAASLNTVRNANIQLPQLAIPRELTGFWGYNIYRDGY